MSDSATWLARACGVIPGGVNSPVRAFRGVGGDPVFVARGVGNEIEDVDGKRYLDFVESWGALLFGHAPPFVVDAAIAALRDGSSFGAPTPREVELAETIRAHVPSMAKIRLCSSGTEATMHAVRLARGFTGRDLIVKMDGCYHGAHDALLASAGSGVATFAVPGSPGIPAAVAALTLVVPFNDEAAVRAVFAAHGERIAAVIVEPLPGNMGVIPPAPGYLEALRALTSSSGALLIFDEVMCGFRVARGGMQARVGVTPDLTCLGKIVGGGFPLAAFGGRADVMDRLSPVGPVYQAGTLSGNPVAVAAGLATLRHVDDDVYARIEARGAELEAGLRSSLAAKSWSLARVGGMFTVYARPEAPTDFATVKGCDLPAFARFFHGALDRGVYLPPSQFEAAFLSATLTAAELDRGIDGLRAAISAA